MCLTQSPVHVYGMTAPARRDNVSPGRTALVDVRRTCPTDACKVQVGGKQGGVEQVGREQEGGAKRGEAKAKDDEPQTWIDRSKRTAHRL